MTLPPEGKGATTRTSLYLFACTMVNCGKEAAAWRALRCQWAPPAPPACATRAAAASDPKAKTVDASGWGVGSSGTATTAAGGALDFSDLAAALDAMGSAAPPPPPPTVKPKDADRGEKEEAAVTEETGGPPGLPGFYLERTAERSGGGGGGRTAAAEAAHVQALLKRYDDAEGGEGAAAVAAEVAAAAVMEVDGPPAGEGATWEGEGYEADEVLAVEGRKGVSRGFLKFMKRLGAAPEQCVRVGGELLWPGTAPPASAPCPRCGAARAHAAQLMAPAIAALEESGEWLRGGGAAEGANWEPPPASWEWVTAAVFACSRRCAGPFIVEEVAVAGEE